MFFSFFFIVNLGNGDIHNRPHDSTALGSLHILEKKTLDF